jgi:hypothetical protein
MFKLMSVICVLTPTQRYTWALVVVVLRWSGYSGRPIAVRLWRLVSRVDFVVVGRDWARLVITRIAMFMTVMTITSQ